MMCPLCQEGMDSDRHASACDVIALIKQRKRDGISIGSVKIGDELVRV